MHMLHFILIQSDRDLETGEIAVAPEVWTENYRT